MKRFYVIIAIIILVFTMLTTYIYADAANFPTGGTENVKIKSASEKIWGTVTIIVQMLAFAAIVFAGLKYMFASANGRAEIKKSLGILVLGAVIVFATSTVVQFVTGIANDIM